MANFQFSMLNFQSELPNLADIAMNKMDQLTLCRSVLDGPQLENLTLEVGARYRIIEEARRHAPLDNLQNVLPPGHRFVPTASSLTLGAILSEQALESLLALLQKGPTGEWLRHQLGSLLACDVDQAWVRCQYAPGSYPPLHAPHGWHQDGGLGFDFLSHPVGNFPSDALVEMATCWIALNHCGVDAPGIEFVCSKLDELLSPSELSDEQVRQQFSSEHFWRPALTPGDALLFRGDLLHRTYVAAHMTQPRTSIELRFFPAERLPSRLKNDRFLILT